MPETRSPRTIFAQQFTELYEAAGSPTLRRVATTAAARMRSAQGARATGPSAQRISDWKAGRNVPARFESLLPVVLTLADLARKSNRSVPKQLLEAREWQRLWHAALTWTPDETDDADCPYLGLTPYRRRDRDRFFGRTHATAEFTDLVRDATGMVILIGASGAGKSSLLAAGLIPALSDWDITAITPGSDPLGALATAWEIDGDAMLSAESVITTLADRRLDRPRLLIVDQFEELFTTCENDGDREEFLTLLHRCATENAASVVLALRADFYARCLTYATLQDALEYRTYLLGPMRPDELAQAITSPARLAGLELESGLDELVITELCGIGDHHDQHSYDPGALPLLSHVMAATWQQRTGRRLTITGYRKAGGVAGAVAETAEQAWSELTDAQQAAAKEVLLGLVTVNPDSRDTRRIAVRSDLLRRTAAPDAATTALEVLSRTRLITLDADSVFLTHEIVLTAWPRLRAWIDADRVGYLVRQRLEADAADWDSSGRDESALYRGARLHTARENVDPPAVGGIARAFLSASETAVRRAQRQSTTGKAILAIAGVILLVLGIAAFTQNRFANQQRDDKNFATVLAEADRLLSVDPTLSAQLLLVADRLRPGDPGVQTRLLATQNLPLATPTPAHDGAIWQVAYGLDGRLLASVGNNTLRLWDTSQAHRPREIELAGLPTDVKSIAFSPNGRMLAVGSAGALQLWDITDPAQPTGDQLRIGLFEAVALVGPAALDTSKGNLELAFGADGRTLAALSRQGGGDLGVTLWDLGDPAKPIARQTISMPSGRFPTMALSPDGRTLAMGNTDLQPDPGKSAGTVELWDTTDPGATKRIGSALALTQQIRTLRFSPDSTLLAVGGMGEADRFGYSGIVQLLSVTDPQRAGALGTPLIDSDAPVFALDFGPDGRTIATAGRTGIKLWNISDRARPTLLGAPLSGSPVQCVDGQQSISCTRDPVSIMFHPKDGILAAGGAEGQIRLWSLAPALLAGHTGWGDGPALNVGGNRMAIDSTDGRIGLWDIADARRPRMLGEYLAEPGAHELSLSPDGVQLAVRGYLSGTTRVVDISDPKHIRPVAEWQVPPATFSPFAFSPDWRLRVTNQPSTTGVNLQMWDIADRNKPQPLGEPLAVGRLSIGAVVSPNGALLAAIGWPGSGPAKFTEAMLWDISRPTQPVRVGAPLHPAGTSTEGVTFHPDNRTLLTWGFERIQLWDYSDPADIKAIGEPITAHGLALASVDISPDGRTMVTSGHDGPVRLWDISDREHPVLLRDSVVPPSTTAWMVRFHPGGGSLIGVSKDGALRLWDLDEEHAAERICDVTNGRATEELWRKYLPDLAYRPFCD